MTLTKEFTPENGSYTVSTLEIGVYTIYDTVLKQFDFPICVPVAKLNDTMKFLVNDPQSKYFGKESTFVLNKIGLFNQETGEIESHFVERVSFLDAYVDLNKRKLQTIVQVLNYLPSGYYQMPSVQKQAIQDRIDNAITEYVANYVIPDLDVSKFDTSKVRDIYNNYDNYVSQSS